MKYLYSLILLLLILPNYIIAQDVIDEDFLDVITKNAAPLWSQSTTQFAASTIPEKYKKESAVIFGFKRELSIDKQSKAGFIKKGEKSLVFFENVRFKIILNDKNSVKSFTEFYFRYSDKVDGFAAKVTKKDGTTTNVDLSEAIKVESVKEVPEFFKSFFDQEVTTGNRYYKVAIPDLEPNDILEYVAITKSKLDVRGNGFIEFSPQYEQCSKKYPILFNQIAIETDDKSYFKALSKNGAPEFKKEVANNSDFFRYVFTDNDRATEKDVNFVNAYRQFPFIKFQVIYSSKDEVKGALMGNTGEIKSNFTKEELAKKAWEDYTLTGKEMKGYYAKKEYASNFWQALKKLGAKDWSEKEYIKNAYYRLRNYVLNNDTYLSDKDAAYFFGYLLTEKDIKYDVVISVSNQIGELKDVLFENEIRYVIKVGKDFYYNYTDHSNPGELVESLLASEAYIITEPNKKTGDQSITPITLPNATYEENTSNLIIDVSLNNDLSSLTVSRTSAYNGINKNGSISDALRYTTVILDDYKNYGGENPTNKMTPKEEAKYNDDVKTFKKNSKEAKDEYVKKDLEKDYGKKVVLKDFIINSDGRSLKNKELNYTEIFELQNMVRKAGKKLLINIPGLVGSQLQFKKEERNRKNDIDVDYARGIHWVINFKIPNGYTLEGINELNNKVENEIGTYSCKATQANGKATIEITKQYKKATFSKAKWNDMLSFIDAAYNTSFKNVLLKPTN